MGRPPLRAASEPARDGIRTRTRRRATEDKMFVPPELKIPGMSYEWKREATLGQEDPQYLSSLMENGWENVSLEEMPNFGRDGDSGVVRRDGQVLMKRPIELTKEARIEDYQIARQQVLGNASKMSGGDVAGLPVRGGQQKTDYRDMPGDFAVSRTATTQIELQD
jgi:hypothetical protein